MTATKETKHTKHDKGRKDLPRLPNSRIKDADKAAVMEELYSLFGSDTKLDAIVSAAKFALDNKSAFLKHQNKNKD
jgi:hypothetical protein